MSNTINKDQNQGYLALYEELEVRYGAAMAQEIVDQIKKVEDKDYQPDYMPVKAASEVLELFRQETKYSLAQLKAARAAQNNLAEDIINLDVQRLLKDFERNLACYWQIQHSFYELYNRALKICEVPETYRYDRYTHPTKMKMAA